MNWTKPSEEMAVSVVLEGDDMEDRCVCCGAVIPEGTMVCPSCFVNQEHIQTNYDRIVAMSLTELAEFICENRTDCCGCAGYDYCVRGAGHANGLIDWLKKEVQNDGEEEA